MAKIIVPGVVYSNNREIPSSLFLADHRYKKHNIVSVTYNNSGGAITYTLEFETEEDALKFSLAYL